MTNTDEGKGMNGRGMGPELFNRKTENTRKEFIDHG